MAMWWAWMAMANAGTVVLPVPAEPGPWMRGEAELCAEARGRGRSLGNHKEELDGGLRFTCVRSEKRVDRVCLTVADVAAWPERWPDGLTCGLGRESYEVAIVEAYDPIRAYGETLWIRRPEGTPIAYTWTFPEGPVSENAQAIRSDGQPWEGVRCEALGDWLSVTVDPGATVDEGRCQFRTVSVPLRLDNVRL